jgi:uncharacterized protein YjbJ (UPF0337 family)
MNQDIAKGKWTEIKGEIQKTWGNLTGDDLEKTKGDMTAVAGLLQQKYGMAKDEASTKISGIYGKFQEKKADLEGATAHAAEKTKEEIKSSTDKTTKGSH